MSLKEVRFRKLSFQQGFGHKRRVNARRLSSNAVREDLNAMRLFPARVFFGPNAK